MATLRVWLCLLALCAAGDPSDIQFAFLKDLYSSTNGDKWLKSTNWPADWNTTDSSYCSDHTAWFGINCDGDNITHITLPGNNLVGSIPLSIGNLQELLYVDLEDNFLHGWLPFTLVTLLKLSHFDVSRNQLGGPVPPQVNPSLAYVDVSHNHFTGALSDFSQEGNLAFVNLADNEFTGTLPAVYASSLTTINISFNQISGPLSLDFMITTLDASNNKLTGTIPPVSDLFNIEYLDFSYNCLNGTFPDLSTNPSLTTLRLAGNKLTGTIPSMDGLDQLVMLDASWNLLTGAVPSLAPLTALNIFDLSHNNLTGSFPQLGSAVSDALAMQYIDLSYNKLTGSIPASIGQLEFLETLILSSNFFAGSIPNQLGNLTKLQDFEVSNNQLNGVLPDWAACGRLARCFAEGNRLQCQKGCPGNACRISGCVACGKTCQASTECSGDDGCSFCDVAKRLCITPSVSPSPSVSASVSPSVGASDTPAPPTPAPGLPMWVFIAIAVGAFLCIIITVVLIVWRVRAATERRKLAGYSPLRNSPDRSHSGSGQREVTRKFTVQGLDVPPTPGGREQAFTFVIDTKLEIIKWADLEILGPIGKGGYGTVMRARRGHTIVAVKLFPSVRSPQQVQEFVEEANVLSDLKHPNCVLFMGVTIEPNHMSIVTEFMKGGDLHSLVYPDEGPLLMTGSPKPMQSVTILTWDRRLQIVYDTAVGLEYLHRRGIAHRDIKLRNILLDDRSPQTVKLCDFGLSGLKKTEPAAAGTERYAAPEIMAGATGDTPSDMYALGIVACEVLFGRMPDIGAADPVPEGPAELREILKACLRKKPSERPTIGRFLATFEAVIRESHPFVNINASPSFGALPFDSPSRNNLFPQFASPRDPPVTGRLVSPSSYRESFHDDTVTRTMTLGATPVTPGSGYSDSVSRTLTLGATPIPPRKKPLR